jgi:enterochelin esterase-like enzyme
MSRVVWAGHLAIVLILLLTRPAGAFAAQDDVDAPVESTGGISARPEETIPSPGRPTSRPSESVMTAIDVRPIETYRHGGALIERSFYSPALRQRMSYWLFLPPDYDGATDRYPVLYLLHGLDADPEQWPFLGVTSTADELIATGEIRPMLIAMPFGSNSYYVDEPDEGLRWADHIADEVVDDVDTHYRTFPSARSRAIGGLSMGGDAALRFGMTRPSTFGVVGAHSPSIRGSYADAPGGIFPDQDAFNRANPLWLAENTSIPKDLRIWIDLGDADPWQWTAEQLHALLDDQGVPNELHEFEGEHDDTYWAEHVPDYLAFYSATLSHQ